MVIRMAETKIPGWVDKNEDEIEDLVIELAEGGKSPSKIGLTLRDQYGIPSVQEVLGKNLLEILEENDLAPDIPEELLNLMREAVKLRNHLDRNPKDSRSQRTLTELESKIHKLTKYYKENDRLPEDWRYDPEKAALLVRG